MSARLGFHQLLSNEVRFVTREVVMKILMNAQLRCILFLLPSGEIRMLASIFLLKTDFLIESPSEPLKTDFQVSGTSFRNLEVRVQGNSFLF